MSKLSHYKTNVDLSTGIRYTSAYVNSQNISHEFIDDICFGGNSRDIGYDNWRSEAKQEFAALLSAYVEHFESEEYDSTLINLVHDRLKSSSYLQSLDIEKSTYTRMTAGDLETNIGSLMTDLVAADGDNAKLEELADQIMETSGYWDYMNDHVDSSGPWILEEQDLEVSYSGDDNSITILKSRFVALIGEASPCFPNGCFMSMSGRTMHVGYALDFNCFDDYSIKTLEDLPYLWIYDLQDDNFVFAKSMEDSEIKTEIVSNVGEPISPILLEEYQLDDDMLEKLAEHAAFYRAAYPLESK